MADNRFFEISKEQSRVKAAIVTKYFEAWANVMMGAQDLQKGRYGHKIAYLDLFAGPGRYDDGTISTPLLILEKAISNPKLRDRLVSIFNDRDRDNTRSLELAISNLPGVQALRYKPKVQNQEVGTKIVKMFEGMRMIPTFFFVDPWGYKGLSLNLVNSVLKDWGCDCVFFFNYNRISMGLPNEMIEDHMNALFGKSRADSLRRILDGLTPSQRELTIVEELCQAIKATGRRFVLPFRFKNDSGTRTSHHLIFVSKGFRGYEIMKDVMARESSSEHEGVASFEYSPGTIRQPLLFHLTRPIEELEEELLDQFAGSMVTRDQIYERHSVDTPYVKKNYTDALLRLEAAGKVTIDSSSRPRRAGTFGPTVRVKFPARRQR